MKGGGRNESSHEKQIIQQGKQRTVVKRRWETSTGGRKEKRAGQHLNAKKDFRGNYGAFALGLSVKHVPWNDRILRFSVSAAIKWTRLISLDRNPRHWRRVKSTFCFRNEMKRQKRHSCRLLKRVSPFEGRKLRSTKEQHMNWLNEAFQTWKLANNVVAVWNIKGSFFTLLAGYSIL